MKNIVKYQVPLFCWSAIIFWLSSIEKIPTLKFFFSPDKIAHASVFFVLCWFSRRAFFHQEAIPWLKKYPLFAAFLFSCVYGVTDEFHQRFVPGRTFDYFDMLADATGAALFLFAFSITQRMKTRDMTEANSAKSV